MIDKIISFDFDGTLIMTPTPEIGEPQWEKATGLSFQGRGWWGNPESLNTKVFYPPVNGWVYKFFDKYINDKTAYTFIATGRLARLETQVKKVLRLHDIDCDVYCNTGGETFNFKCRLFERLMRENPTAKELIMFDDRESHLIQFEVWAKKQSIKVTIIDVIRKTTKIIN